MTVKVVRMESCRQSVDPVTLKSFLMVLTGHISLVCPSHGHRTGTPRIAKDTLWPGVLTLSIR